MKYLRRLSAALWAMALCVSIAVSAFAAEGNVTYSGDAGKFIFEPGSKHSPTDLFSEFKDVMPGDTISQKILVVNKASKKVEAKIYMRALGAQPESQDFLSQLVLDVEIPEQNARYTAAADQSGQLADWVCLGTFDSGAKVELDVTLTVPVTLDSTYMDQMGLLDWEFMVEEIPVNPEIPQTGDTANLMLYVGLFAVGCVGIFVILFAMRRRKN